MGAKADPRKVLLTGASGYVGGRMLPLLREAGYAVRCMARRPEYLAARVPADVEVVQGDVLDAESLRRACAGVDAAYYLVHSMGSADASFAERDRRGAEQFGAAAREAGVRRLVYLGGLGGEDGPASDHLASRHEVGRILRHSGVPTVEFRASIIIGSGSLSFELIRALVERLPVMVTPRWVRRLAQPIAIDDVLAYLLAALDIELGESRIFEIGGAERASYRDLMVEYAHQRGLKRLIMPVPVLTPRLSSLWLGFVTPVYARVGRKLVESLRSDTVVHDPSARQVFGLQPGGVGDAIAAALRKEDRGFALTRWSDALSVSTEPRQWGGVRFGSRLVDSRSMQARCGAEQLFDVVEAIGGDTGWYYGNWLWKVRGWLDLLVGGPGLRRGRRDPQRVLPGEALDFWRVEEVERPRLLRLHAEMKLPGRAWLQFEVDATEGGSRLRQTALFDPLGLSGRLYWYGIYPIHGLVFGNMLRNIVRAAERSAERAERGAGA